MDAATTTADSTADSTANPDNAFQTIQLYKMGFEDFHHYTTHASELIPTGSDFVLDLTRLAVFNSAVVCLMLFIQRECNKNQCQFSVRLPSNNDQLKNLLSLYNIEKLFTTTP